MKNFNTWIEEGGLWDNIRKRKASGKKMRKKGEKGAPTADAIKSAQKEDAPANAVAHGGVDMNPTGQPRKMDKRMKYHPEKVYRRSRG
jgi:hypothetical protein